MNPLTRRILRPSSAFLNLPEMPPPSSEMPPPPESEAASDSGLPERAHSGAADVPVNSGGNERSGENINANEFVEVHLSPDARRRAAEMIAGFLERQESNQNNLDNASNADDENVTERALTWIIKAASITRVVFGYVVVVLVLAVLSGYTNGFWNSVNTVGVVFMCSCGFGLLSSILSTSADEVVSTQMEESNRLLEFVIQTPRSLTTKHVMSLSLNCATVGAFCVYLIQVFGAALFAPSATLVGAGALVSFSVALVSCLYLRFGSPRV